MKTLILEDNCRYITFFCCISTKLRITQKCSNSRYLHMLLERESWRGTYRLPPNVPKGAGFTQPLWYRIVATSCLWILIQEVIWQHEFRIFHMPRNHIKNTFYFNISQIIYNFILLHLTCLHVWFWTKLVINKLE